VEYMLPLAYHWYRDGVISRERLIALSAGRAAAFFGLNKGALTPGRDGDVVLVDPVATWHIGQGDDVVASKCGWTPYEGRAMRGRPMVTIVGGRLVYQHPHA
jgi:dihydroorotase-like cyclic amidohydrolase